MGITTSQAYFPLDHGAEFENDYTIVEWLTQYSDEKDVTYVRGFLGRMLFSGDDGVKRVSVLSGGEKVRCMLSKMMISGANVLLLDEPTNNLDPANQQEVMREVRREVDERGIAACAVMHDINLAIRYCDRFLFLKDGKVDAVGGRECVTPERIKRIYGMDADIIEHGGRPVVIPR